eukprot:FR739789.1.p1 GENE.FR739789.1~~FR739789.1.p1  ORF type:complete len:187 (+),score=16.72 FR739789.1:78-563(+)
MVSVSMAQDLTGKFTSCSDSQRMCHLGCVVPKERADTEMAWPVNQPMTKDEVNLCVERCDTDTDACTDSDEVVDNQNCMLECARKYDSSMKKCVSMVSATARSTFGQNLDSCSIKASSKHDACTTECVGVEDYRLSGWSFPEEFADVKKKYDAYKALAEED